TVMERGHMLHAFVTISTSGRLDLPVAYEGIRSLGKYIYSWSRYGNFRSARIQQSQQNGYLLYLHLSSQDLYNGANRRLTHIEHSESGEALYTDRARLDVFYRDATSFLKGDRFFLDHSFRINKEEQQNNLALTHQFYYEYKEFEFYQETPSQRLGASYVSGR